MKKIILAVIFTLVFVLVGSANALTPPPPESLEQTIARLRAEVMRLQLQLAELLAEQEASFCHTFNHNLRAGDGHPDWVKLQTVLRLERLASVASLQERYASDILNPLGLTRGTGYVGPSTRAVLNRLYGCRISGSD